MSLSTCRDRGTGRCGGSVSLDQLDFRCHWRERIRSLARGTSFSKDDMCPNNTCHRRAGGLGTYLPGRGISVCGPRWGNARADIVSMIMPRYLTDLDGRGQTSPCLLLCRGSGKVRGVGLVLIREVDKISQSSRYRSRRIPRALAQEETAAKALVNTCGAVDSPNIEL